MNTFNSRFAGHTRVFGRLASELLPQLHICVIGIGGVGSWSAEGLARAGVGHITLIDPDDIAECNINRQLHALSSTLEQSKVEVMKRRILDINPECQCHAIEDLLVENNVDRYIRQDFDYVIDAIDSIRFKAALIHFCRRRKIRIVTTGGAGGRNDPLKVGVADLSRTWNDPLAAKVRARLRSEYGFSKNPKRRFDVECVYSHEQPKYPTQDGAVGFAKPGIKGLMLDCEQGYGSVGFVTSVFGLVAASRAVNKSLNRRLKARTATSK